MRFLSKFLAVGILWATPACAQSLNGAGSTFINPIMTNWTAAYQRQTGVQVNYQSIGSGGGINALINKTVSFAGSDAPMNASELAQVGGSVLHLPAVIGAEAVAYNVPGVGPGLRLTGPVIAAIYLGRISFWDDPVLVKLNRNVKLPHTRIFVAHRSDGSGTTYIFTDYLAKISPEWKRKVGTGKSVQWPVGVGGKGNEGVAGLLRLHPYSFGYVELAYALQNHINYAQVQNKKGRFLLPSAKTASLAADGVTLPTDLRASLTNTANSDGYPIVGFSWLIVRLQSVNAPTLKSFVQWCITKGQSFCAPLAYASLPPALQKKEVGMIARIR